MVPVSILDRFAIIVGDSGLRSHDVGRNFERVADTRAEALIKGGDTVNIFDASSALQLGLAITTGDLIDGGVIYYGHGSSYSLFIGESSDPGTNLNGANISSLLNNNLGPDAMIEINAAVWGQIFILDFFSKDHDMVRPGKSIADTICRGLLPCFLPGKRETPRLQRQTDRLFFLELLERSLELYDIRRRYLVFLKELKNQEWNIISHIFFFKSRCPR